MVNPDTSEVVVAQGEHSINGVDEEGTKPVPTRMKQQYRMVGDRSCQRSQRFLASPRGVEGTDKALYEEYREQDQGWKAHYLNKE